MELIERQKGKRRKRKGFGIACCFMLFALSFQQVQAQTFAEWFEQKKTLIKYLTQQIAALDAYERSLKQGYNELKSDWTAIGNFKDGELGLHQAYYTSLNQVNPEVTKCTDMNSIQSEQQSIISQFNAISSLYGLTPDEQAYIRTVQQGVITGCTKDMNDLQAVLTPGELVMSDDERMKRVAAIADNIKDKYLFTCNFCCQVRLLAVQRDEENNESQTLNQLYGISN